MRTLSDAGLLGLWESGLRRHPLDRALLTLAAAFPETPRERLADWPIGRRNQALARARCAWFGPLLRAWTACVNCGEKLELEMNAQLLAGGEFQESANVAETVTAHGRTFRLPTSRDLARAVNETDSMAGAVRIAESCLVDAKPPAHWSGEELTDLGEKLTSADPFAETLLSLHCPGCGKEWQAALDLASFFWREIEGRVRQVLFSIHTLAAAYGWSEEDVLSLSDERRAIYMEMAQA